MAWCYLLLCADGTYYVGSTIDLERRESEHQLGLGAAYTRRPGRRPVRVVWAEHYERVDDAFAREKQIRHWSRAKREALIGQRYEDLPGLARRARRRT